MQKYAKMMQNYLNKNIFKHIKKAKSPDFQIWKSGLLFEPVRYYKSEFIEIINSSLFRVDSIRCFINSIASTGFISDK